jgi:tetratricopeptide (TPR) repeat protein
MDLHDKSGLLIDDMPEMRSAMRIQLADAGLEKCDTARNVKEAVDKLRERRYDLIVCDYNLGQGADGQQLLELVRRKQILPLSTAFLIVTGETGYEQVSTAAEYAPDDYLLKPFTAELLGTRIGRILDKKVALAPIYRYLGSSREGGDRAQALAACDALLAQGGRYLLDVLRLKGELLAAMGRHQEALALYEGVLQQRATPWAEVGKARILAALGQEDAAKDHLQHALAAYPNYLAAYDSLAQLVEKTDKAAAQQIVERALQVAPSTQRQRRLGNLAFENKDFARAETAFRRTVEKDRTGFFKGHDDYVGLAKSCVEQGKTGEALAAVKDMGASFANTPELKARQAAVECQVHVRSGNEAAAKTALERALGMQKSGGLDAATALEVAQACFASGRQEEAKQIIQAVAEDHDENPAILAQAQSVFATAGLDDEGTVFLDATKKRMIKLNNDAVALAKAGQLDAAIAMLSEAADRLPNNCQISINAAQALLMHVLRNGANAAHVAQAQRYIDQAQHINPEHPKLAEATAFYNKIAAAGAART